MTISDKRFCGGEDGNNQLISLSSWQMFGFPQFSWKAWKINKKWK
jgi:hypothetical protein